MILISLITPQPSVGGFDLAAIALGNPLSVILGEALAPVLTSRPYEVADPESGKLHDVFPCAIREGMGAKIPLGKYEVAVFVRGEELIVAVPAAITGMARHSLSSMLADGRCRYVGTGPGPDGFTGSFGLFAFRPVPGASWTLKVAGLRLGFVFNEEDGNVATP